MPNELSELGKTQSPDNLTEYRLGTKDVEDYLAFDNANFFDSETPETHRPPAFTPEEIGAAIDRGDLLGALTLENGEWVAIYWFTPEPDVSTLKISNLAVKREYRGQGIGKHFLAKAEAVASEHGLDTCGLIADPLNTPGIGLYLSTGYLIREYLTDDPDGLSDWIYMTKSLVSKTEVDPQETTDVLAGDEAQLKQMLDAGYAGYKITGAVDNDPTQASISFAKPIESM